MKLVINCLFVLVFTFLSCADNSKTPISNSYLDTEIYTDREYTTLSCGMPALLDYKEESYQYTKAIAGVATRKSIIVTREKIVVQFFAEHRIAQPPSRNPQDSIVASKQREFTLQEWIEFQIVLKQNSFWTIDIEPKKLFDEEYKILIQGLKPDKIQAENSKHQFFSSNDNTTEVQNLCDYFEGLSEF